MIDLKRCPFCGSAELRTKGTSNFRIICCNCGAASGAHGLKANAANAWNRRVTDEMEDDLK